jgi:hypothetical protein
MLEWAESLAYLSRLIGLHGPLHWRVNRTNPTIKRLPLRRPTFPYFTALPKLNGPPR